jgi:tetratricopeptide (TPR) repeat protein
LPPDVYAFHQAEALAGLGRLDEAIELVRPLGNGQQMPLWLYWCRMGGLYFRAKEHDQGIACEENASQLAPDNPTVIISLALSLLQYRRDAKRARCLLQEARTHTLSDLLVPVVEMAEGIAALEEGQPAEAQRLLEGSLPKFQPFLRSNPLISTWLAMIHAYLALAATALADHASARRHFGLAEPRLHALRSDDLLSRCQRAIPGGPLP